jgi:hypothetical protein
MTSFNKAIAGLVSIEEAIFGPEFTGHVPDDHRLKGLNAREQFSVLSGILDYAEFQAEVSANRKAVFLNCLYWLKAILSDPEYDRVQRELFLTRLAKAWNHCKIGVPLPLGSNSE